MSFSVNACEFIKLIRHIQQKSIHGNIHLTSLYKLNLILQKTRAALFTLTLGILQNGWLILKSSNFYIVLSYLLADIRNLFFLQV